MMLEKGESTEARRKLSVMDEKTLSTLSACRDGFVGRGGGGGAEVVEVCDMHRVCWRERVRDGMLRKARRAVLGDMVGVCGALNGGLVEGRRK
jgi:hypothetical protein